jgi:hypothetical protein
MLALSFQRLIEFLLQVLFLFLDLMLIVEHRGKGLSFHPRLCLNWLILELLPKQ